MNESGKSDCARSGRKVLYAASTFGHLRSFPLPYIEALRADGFDVTLLLLAAGILAAAFAILQLIRAARSGRRAA